jgi:branched-chain amino acid transport system ATP-binding protein
MILDVDNLRVAYGPVVAVHALSLALPEGDSLALLGANGAGKTSTVEAIAGLIPSASGSVRFAGRVINNQPASRIVRGGLALVPQWRELFPAFTVEETLVAGMTAAAGRDPMAAEEIYAHFPVLGERRRQLAGSLSGGEQQMLAIGRALIGRPRVLLLDEPSAGLAVGILRKLTDIILRIRETGVSMIVVEQNLDMARALAPRCVVLAAGRAVWQGPMADAGDIDEIRQAYFA